MNKSDEVELWKLEHLLAKVSVCQVCYDEVPLPIQLAQNWVN